MKLFKEGKFHFLQPLVYMGKDYNDTFKPFKSSFYIKRDLLQPIHGAINIYNGIVDLKGSSIALGITEIFRGLTQIATTPLTWFLRLPFRGIITLFTGFQKAENGAGIQIEVSKGKRILDLLENYNVQTSEIQKALQSRQEVIETRDETNTELLTSDQILIKQVADEKLNTVVTELEKGVVELTKVRDEILPLANDVADTVIRKYEKAKQRGQATELSNPIEPLTVTLNEANKFRTQSFFNGLKLFDSDKSQKSELYWVISDNARKLSPDRCGL